MPLMQMGYIIETLRQDNVDADFVRETLRTSVETIVGLSNPVNVSELALAILTAPGTWSIPDRLKSSLELIKLFHTAALAVANCELLSNGVAIVPSELEDQVGDLSFDEWVAAIQDGVEEADAWKKTLVYAGLLLGGAEYCDCFSPIVEPRLAHAFGIIVNEVLDASTRNELPDHRAAGSMIVALSVAHHRLSSPIQMSINNDTLALTALQVLTGVDGLENGEFLSGIKHDVWEEQPGKLHWPGSSQSFVHVLAIQCKPVIEHIPQIARLVEYAVGNLKKPLKALKVREHMVSITQNIHDLWAPTPFSDVDPLEEEEHLSFETINVTFPLLKSILFRTLFITAFVLQSVLSRTAIERTLSKKLIATATAKECLEVLRYMNFVAYTNHHHLSSSYQYVLNAAIDLLAPHQIDSIQFLNSIYPPQAGRIPVSSFHRNLDLFYMNVSEHFSLKLPKNLLVKLIAKPATPYLCPPPDIGTAYVEAAHSTYLMLLAAPNAGPFIDDLMPTYITTLFQVFPERISPAQFKIAFRSLIQYTTSPSPISRTHPELYNTLLELLNDHARHASVEVLDPPPVPTSASVPHQSYVPLSAQAHYLLALLACMPHIPYYEMEEWLDHALEITQSIEDQVMQNHIYERFMDLLLGNEMDSTRAACCHHWWATRSGESGAWALAVAAEARGVRVGRSGGGRFGDRGGWHFFGGGEFGGGGGFGDR